MHPIAKVSLSFTGVKSAQNADKHRGFGRVDKVKQVVLLLLTLGKLAVTPALSEVKQLVLVIWMLMEPFN